MSICTIGALALVKLPWTPAPVYRIRSQHHLRFCVHPYVRATSETTTQDTKMTRRADDVVGIVVTPSIVNKPWFRITAVLGTLLLASAYFQQPLPNQVMKLTRVFAFSTWFGSSIWVFLISPKIMFMNLGRQTFGRLQGKLFPQFFGLSVACTVLLLGTQPAGGIPYVLIVGLISSLLNWLVFEPIITARTAERYELENAEVKDQERIQMLMKATSRYHGLSSVVGLITLCSAVACGSQLASTLTY